MQFNRNIIQFVSIACGEDHDFCFDLAYFKWVGNFWLSVAQSICFFGYHKLCVANLKSLSVRGIRARKKVNIYKVFFNVHLRYMNVQCAFLANILRGEIDVPFLLANSNINAPES